MTDIQHKNLTGKDMHLPAHFSDTDPILNPTNNVVAGLHWIDTSANPWAIKIRNVNNTGWIILASMDVDKVDGEHASAFEHVGNKGNANGYAELDGDGKVPADQLPAIAITETFVVNDEAEMLALDAQVGDVAIRLDESKTYILALAPPTVLANWKELLTHGIVESVNGKQGIVVLKTDDISDALQTQKYVSTDEKDAIAGTNGTPSATNKFVTNSDPRNSDARIPSNDASLVHKTGTESIAGLKTFSNNMTCIGDVEFTTNAVGVILKSVPGGYRYRLTVNDAGVLVTELLP